MLSFSHSRTFKCLMTCALLAVGGIGHAQQVFRVTTIPEEAATEQIRKFAPIAKYLESKLGMKVEFTPVTDYPAAVEAMVGKKVDLVWFGGFTYVQASIRSQGKIIPIASAKKTPNFSRSLSPRPTLASKSWKTSKVSRSRLARNHRPRAI